MTADQFKEFRTRARMTQDQMGRFLGVTMQTVCNYERGFTRVPRVVQRLLDRITPEDTRRTYAEEG